VFYSNDSIPGTTALRYDAERDLLWAMVPPVGSIGFDPEKGLVWQDSPEQMGRARLISIEKKSGTLQHEFEFPQGSFSNDLTFGPDGMIYITDSRRPQVFRLNPETGELEIYVRDAALHSLHVGLAGIGCDPHGNVFVGNFSEGTLHRIRRGGAVEAIELPRQLNFPDGLVVLSRSEIVITEGAATGGSGKVSLVTLVEEKDRIRGKIKVLADGLDTPVNLTQDGQVVYVTDARVRHLFEPSLYERPEFFRIVRIELGKKTWAY
jgi:sugar lactone lactonase YvrE